MTTREAALLMGCTQKHVLKLIGKGRLTARQVPVPYGVGFVHDVSRESVNWYNSVVSRKGWPRGKTRSDT